MNGFRHRAARVLGHVAVVIGILAVIAAAFALSYDAVRDIARAAGVPVTLARIYPGILDAVFLVACAAALMLRDARWWTRLYTWLSVLVTGGLIGAADAYHSMGLKLPHRTTAGTIAAVPWILVMLAFSLWLSMLRHSRSGATAPAAGPERSGPGEIASPAPLAGPEPSALDGTASPALALTASPEVRAALPAADPEPVHRPSIKNIEGRSVENQASAEVPAAKGPVEGRSAGDPVPAEGSVVESAVEDHAAENQASAEVPAAEGPVEGRSAGDPPPAEVPAARESTEGRSAGDPVPAEGSAAESAVEGHDAENPVAAEVTADKGPGDGAPETGDDNDPAEPAASADARPDHGDAADDEVLGEQEGKPSSPAGPHPSDADTPPYGFPAVTGQDVTEQAAQNGSRTPTLLSAPVPADVAAPPESGSDETRPDSEAVAGPAPAAEAEPEPSEPEEVAAKGRPPAASPELSGTAAELAHEDQPAKKPPTPFERVRSTPTRPAAPEEDGAA